MDAALRVLRLRRYIDPRLYSHKFHSTALGYEIAVSIHTGNLLWAGGPYRPGEYTDVLIYRENLKKLLDPGELVSMRNLTSYEVSDSH